MLSGETAIGHDPVNAVATMARIAARADDEFDYDGWARDLSETAHRRRCSRHRRRHHRRHDHGRPGGPPSRPAPAPSSASPSTGFTVRSIARFRPQAQILGLQPRRAHRAPAQPELGGAGLPASRRCRSSEMISRALELARTRGEVRSGDLVAVLAGSPEYHGKATDTLRLMRVP